MGGPERRRLYQRSNNSLIRFHCSFVIHRTPSFEIHQLQSGVHYGVELFAENDKGESERTRVPVYTLKNPEKQTDYIATAPVMEEIKPFLPIIMGASGGLVLIGLLIIIIVRMRSSGGQERNMNTVNNTCANHTPTNNTLSNGMDALLFNTFQVVVKGSEIFYSERPQSTIVVRK